MGSRTREKIEHFFECFCEVVPPTQDKAAWIIQQYPDNYKDEEVLKSVPKFAYPCKFENTVIQHYSFVLTDIESKWTFGFCRHDPRSETALVVLSNRPWSHAFYKLLDNIAVLTHSSNSEDLREFLNAVYTKKIENHSGKFSVRFNKGESVFTVDCPSPFQLPSIPEDRNLNEYYNAVDTQNMMLIFASMLYERRIIFTSRKLSRLSACVQSANNIIYPMIWQHIFIPVLPMTLIDYLLAPMPFLIGVPEEVLKKVNRAEIGDVVILNADTNEVETPFDDLNNLPSEVVSSLKKQLKPKAALLGDGVSRAFLRTLVQLIGGYRDALTFQPGQKVTFNEQKFIESRPVSSQPFLKEMLNLQIFQQFIEERLQMLNNGLGFSDEFEIEVCKYSEKSSSKLKQQYKDWATTMKKEGSAFFKSVKERANPAMKSAVKTVKDGGKGVKSAYKGLRSKLRDSQQPQHLENGIDSTRDKPRSAPNSPSGKRHTGFTSPTITYRKDPTIRSNTDDSQFISHIQNSPEVQESIDIPKIDLINEMQEFLPFPLDDTPPIDRSLKPVRSLENFKNSSPISSPERWIFPLRTSAQTSGTSSKLFLAGNQQGDTQNLLQSPDDVFSSPPLLKPTKDHDIFGSEPFVVGGGRNENGDPVFLYANQHTVDVVKLSPPVHSSQRKKKEDTQDLIRLDSSSDIDEFDPLKSSSYSSQFEKEQVPMSITNPLYNYENCNLRTNSQSNINYNNRETRDLLQEYGLNFDNFNTTTTSTSQQSKSNKNQWTTFE